MPVSDTALEVTASDLIASVRAARAAADAAEIEPGTYLWRSPHGQRLLRTRDGTRDVTP